MCVSRTCTYPCGEEEFRRYEGTLLPDRVMYPAVPPVGPTRDGVMINCPAHQWEIVAVQGESCRHVAFISTLYCLDRVLDVASQ